MNFTALEPPLHRPRPCPQCSVPSTAIVEGRCLSCRSGPADLPDSAPAARCDCGSRLLLVHPDRTRCERCRLDDPSAA